MRLSIITRVLTLPVALVGALAAAMLIADVARADLKLCNTTSSRVGVAIGYQDAQGWTTEGWWNIPAQTCETLYKGQRLTRFVYVHAVDYDRGGGWAGKASMCTGDKSFTIRGTADCQQRGYTQTEFFEVDIGESKDWTVRLTDPGEGGAKPQ